MGYLEEGHPDLDNLTRAQAGINSIINIANEKKRVSDNLNRILKIQGCISWPDQAFVVRSLHTVLLG